MSLEFQRPARPFPGVRLTIGQGGLCTTIRQPVAVVRTPAARPEAPVTYRARARPGLDLAPARLTGWPDEAAVTMRGPEAGPASAGLDELRRLVEQAALRRRALAKAVEDAEAGLRKAESRLKIASAFVVRILTLEQVPRLIEAAAAARAAVEAAQTELDACRVDVDFGLDAPALQSYAALTSTFEALSRCQAIWNLTGERASDQVAEGTMTPNSVARSRVGVAVARPDIIGTRLPILRLASATGREVSIYPGFVTIADGAGNVALLDLGDVIISCAPVPFMEAQEVPPDAEVIGQSRSEPPVPLVRYGELEIASLSGQSEVFLTSDFPRGGAFARAYLRHAGTLAELVKRGPAGEPSPAPFEEQQGPAPTVKPAAAEPARWKPNLVGDWISLLALVMVMTYAVLAVVDQRPPPPPVVPATRPPPAVVDDAPKPAPPPAKPAPRRRTRSPETQPPETVNGPIQVVKPQFRLPDDPASIPY
jgi:hypothetical protein